jgi:hypothetical protein
MFEIEFFELDELTKQDIFPVPAGEWGFPNVDLVEVLDSDPDISFVSDSELVGLNSGTVEGAPWWASSV